MTNKAIPVIIALIIVIGVLGYILKEMYEPPIRLHDNNQGGYVNDSGINITCTRPFEMNHELYCDIDNTE